MMKKDSRGSRFLDKFAEVSAKIGNEVHLRSLRDAFALIMPLFILAGVAVLFNNVFFPKIASGETLLNLQYWGNTITRGTLSIAGLVLAPAIGYLLAKNKGFINPMAASIVALSSLIMTNPETVELLLPNSEKAEMFSGVISFGNVGTTGMFAGIIVGLLSVELFIKLSSIKRLEINLGDNIPPAVSASFSALLPAALTLSAVSLVATLLYVFGNTDLITLITNLIQEPLRRVNTSLPGIILIYSCGNLLFTLGIHQTVINGTLLDPLMLLNLNENMAAYAAHKAIPNVLVNTDHFGMIGGSGSTLCLLIATFLFSKMKSSRDVAALSVAPGVFNINEPVIFGYPIVFNIPMIIPFVLQPAIGLTIQYVVTSLGWLNRVVVMVPWTTPPLLNSYLATAGDWRAPLWQLLVIVLGVLLYLPFMKISERILQKQAAMPESI
ncbi:PTS sugar transporter subunit IIC [Enterococcus hulanensis]|nr:PTS transporter subunit EIIC [Enterococcus hulanensis]MBO0455389.1 PTS sugar transporter subunit IIC [Enterococcus hulanensis]